MFERNFYKMKQIPKKEIKSLKEEKMIKKEPKILEYPLHKIAQNYLKELRQRHNREFKEAFESVLEVMGLSEYLNHPNALIQLLPNKEGVYVKVQIQLFESNKKEEKKEKKRNEA